MDSDYLLFASIVDAGSLSAAGRRLSISAAMMSKRLARLEARLGARLIHRTTRKMALTGAGERFHADVVAILDQARRAEERVSDTGRAPSGVLKVSVPTSFGRIHVAPHLRAFMDRYPMVELEVHLSDDFVDLVEDRIDLAVRITAQTAAGLTFESLAPSRRILCASPDYLADHGMPGSVDDLRGHHLLAAEGQMPWLLVAGDQRVTIDQPSRLRTNSSELVRELALSGGGIALRSLWDVGDLLATGQLVRVLERYEGSTDVAVYAVHHGGEPVAPTVRAFVSYLKTCLSGRAW